MIRKAVVMLLLAVPAAAQVHSRPTDPPLVIAASESWFQLREPINLAGDVYYPAGAAVFFDGNTMARTGHYNGVPIYSDTTLEPYSVILVPARRGLMQPYERLRRGDLAGTTGSRTPAFPVRLRPDAQAQVAWVPIQDRQTIGAISAFTPASGAAVASQALAVGSPVGNVPSGGAAIGRPPDTTPLVSVRLPENNDGLWVRFSGEKWVSAGAAVPLRVDEFTRIGEHVGFPVFAREHDGKNRIYLPTRAGLVAPYKRK